MLGAVAEGQAAYWPCAAVRAADERSIKIKDESYLFVIFDTAMLL